MDNYHLKLPSFYKTPSKSSNSQSIIQNTIVKTTTIIKSESESISKDPSFKIQSTKSKFTSDNRHSKTSQFESKYSTEDTASHFQSTKSEIQRLVDVESRSKFKSKTKQFENRSKNPKIQNVEDFTNSSQTQYLHHKSKSQIHNYGSDSKPPHQFTESHATKSENSPSMNVPKQYKSSIPNDQSKQQSTSKSDRVKSHSGKSPNPKDQQSTLKSNKVQSQVGKSQIPGKFEELKNGSKSCGLSNINRATPNYDAEDESTPIPSSKWKADVVSVSWPWHDISNVSRQQGAGKNVLISSFSSYLFYNLLLLFENF